MDTILVGIYAIGGLTCIFYILSVVTNLLQKKRNITDDIISIKMLVLLAFMLAFTPWYWYTNYLCDRIPDGDYRINVSIYTEDSNVALSLPADLSISSESDYEDTHYNLGAVEMDSSKRVLTKSFYLYNIHHGSISQPETTPVDLDVYPETDISVEDEYGYEYFVNIGVITPQTLGLSKKDIWQSLSIVPRLEPVVIVLFCLLGIVLYFKGKKEKEDIWGSDSERTDFYRQKYIEYLPAIELLDRLAFKAGLSRAAYIRYIRIQEKQAEGMDEEEAIRAIAEDDKKYEGIY